MNKTAQLVLSFAEFEERYPNAGIDDFARHLLARSRTAKPSNPAEVPVIGDLKGHSILAKVIGRLMRLNAFYANTALESIGLGGLDEFTYLLSIEVLKDPMKTEVINLNFHELSSGLLIISRLKNKGFVKEKPDLHDKRSKRIALSKKGSLKLAAAQVELSRVSRMFFEPLGEDDIRLCVSMLAPIEQDFAARWPIDKGKSFQEIAEGFETRAKLRAKAIK